MLLTKSPHFLEETPYFLQPPLPALLCAASCGSPTLLRSPRAAPSPRPLTAGGEEQPAPDRAALRGTRTGPAGHRATAQETPAPSVLTAGQHRPLNATAEQRQAALRLRPPAPHSCPALPATRPALPAQRGTGAAAGEGRHRANRQRYR